MSDDKLVTCRFPNSLTLTTVKEVVVNHNYFPCFFDEDTGEFVVEVEFPPTVSDDDINDFISDVEDVGGKAVLNE